MIKRFLLLCIIAGVIHADNILIYDEEKGIIFVDKESDAAKKSLKKAETRNEEKRQTTPQRKPGQPVGLTRARGPSDIHVDRKKDPPELYLKSGLEYYRNNDFENALKNFKYAADQDIRPEYLLWLGKTYRQLDKKIQMFTIMERILNDYPESEVADDALFEMAFYYQKSDDYQKATDTYKQLIEQYPFGVSYSKGDEFLDIAREQIRRMRGEMMSELKVLGIEGEELADAYKLFQRSQNLVVTGVGDPETVKAIKQKYNEKLKEDEKRAEALRRMHQSSKYALILGLVVLLNCVVILIARVKITQNQKLLIELQGMVSDLQKGQV
jgi:tetratricopeptide (TPR) repeat protein